MKVRRPDGHWIVGHVRQNGMGLSYAGNGLAPYISLGNAVEAEVEALKAMIRRGDHRADRSTGGDSEEAVHGTEAHQAR